MPRPLIGAGLLVLLLFPAGCTSSFLGLGQKGDVSLDDVHTCAVGYDLARKISENVSLRGNVLVSPKQGTACERFALHYLRRSGFAIDEAGKSPTFEIELEYVSESEFQATASIGRTLRVSRVYVPGDGGVYPVSPVSIMRLSGRTVWRAPAESIRHEPGS